MDFIEEAMRKYDASIVSKANQM